MTEFAFILSVRIASLSAIMNELSNDSLYKICTFLLPSEIVRVSLINKQIFNILQNEIFWKSICNNESYVHYFDDIFQQDKREHQIESIWKHYAQVVEGFQKLNKVSLWRLDEGSNFSTSPPKMEGHSACFLLDRYVILVGQ